MSSFIVKICGIRRLADALTAADAGADYVGIVFVPGRRRRVEPTDARVITDGLRNLGPGAPRSVGLFGDQPLGDVMDIIRAAGLDCVQLCGDESIEYCRQAQEYSKVIKVLHVPNDVDADAIAQVGRQIDAYAAAGCMVTLDSQVTGLHGGTGQSFDWSIAAQLSAGGRQFLLAGGLTPDNVAASVAEANPWGVDVSSGTETDGEKDHDKIRNFIVNARRGGQSAEVS